MRQFVNLSVDERGAVARDNVNPVSFPFHKTVLFVLVRQNASIILQNLHALGPIDEKVFCKLLHWQVQALFEMTLTESLL